MVGKPLFMHRGNGGTAPGSEPKVPGPVATKTDSRWQARPGTARIVKAIAVVIPVIFGAVGAVVASRLVPAPRSLGSWMLWLAVLLAGMVIPFLVFARFAQRLLPLSVLLELSMLFPDDAPSRLAVARKAGRTRDLKKKLEELRELDPDGNATKAAAGVLELIAYLGTHDRRTRGHSERVRALTDMLADEIGFSPAERDRLRWAALLHDLGKLTVDPDLLNKPGRPDESEWATLRRHPLEGARIAEPLWTWLGPWIGAIEHHHERFDGSGYPFGLAGQQISMGGRIVAVSDSYEVMTAARAYKKPMSVAAARRELVRSSGTHFDPTIVRAFLAISTHRLLIVAGFLALVAQLPVLGGLWSRGLTARLGRTGAGLAATAVTVAALSMGGAIGSGSSPASSRTAAAPAPASVDLSDQPGPSAAGEAQPPAPPGDGRGALPGPSPATAAAPGQDTGSGNPAREVTAGEVPPREDPTREPASEWREPPDRGDGSGDPPPTYAANGEIRLVNPLARRVGGVTQNDFEQRCDVPPSQGVDGWVFSVPSEREPARAIVTGTNPLGGHALDAYLYSDSCKSLGTLSTASPDERGQLPPRTAFVVVNESARPGTTVALRVRWTL